MLDDDVDRLVVVSAKRSAGAALVGIRKCLLPDLIGNHDDQLVSDRIEHALTLILLVVPVDLILTAGSQDVAGSIQHPIAVLLADQFEGEAILLDQDRWILRSLLDPSKDDESVWSGHAAVEIGVFVGTVRPGELAAVPGGAIDRGPDHRRPLAGVVGTFVSDWDLPGISQRDAAMLVEEELPHVGVGEVTVQTLASPFDTIGRGPHDGGFRAELVVVARANCQKAILHSDHLLDVGHAAAIQIEDYPLPVEVGLGQWRGGLPAGCD